MPAKAASYQGAEVRDLFSRTDAYFARVGLLPLLLPLPIHGDCGALKRGLLRSCVLCSDHVHSSLRRALLQQQQQKQQEQQQDQQQQQNPEGGTLTPSEGASSGVLPGAAEQSNLRSSRGTPSAGEGDSPKGPSSNPIEEALLPAKLLREKLRLFALELEDPELQQIAGAPLLSREELGLAHLRQVLECLDSSHAEGVLLLLCERRSAAVSGGPYRASLDTLMNATPAQLAERQQLLHQEQQQQPPLHDLGLGAVAGGLVTVAASGQRQLKFLFSVEELPDDARHQLVRVLVVRLMALAFVWPSVFWSSSLQSDDDLRVPAQLLLHFPRAARDFLCLPSGLQLSRHFETEEDVEFNHADQVRGCACVKRMQRKLQQQAGRARQDAKGSPSSSSSSQQQQQQQQVQDASPREGLPLPCSFEGLPTDWLEFWAVSKRRFYATWAQRSSQLVPDDPATSLLEAFDLPLKFADEADKAKPLSLLSPTRRRGPGGPRPRRAPAARTSGPPITGSCSDAATAEAPCAAAYAPKTSSRKRARTRTLSLRPQQSQHQQQSQQPQQQEQQQDHHEQPRCQQSPREQQQQQQQPHEEEQQRQQHRQQGLQEQPQHKQQQQQQQQQHQEPASASSSASTPVRSAVLAGSVSAPASTAGAAVGAAVASVAAAGLGKQQGLAGWGTRSLSARACWDTREADRGRAVNGSSCLIGASKQSGVKSICGNSSSGRNSSSSSSSRRVQWHCR
ncbi:hypothetical protein Emag_005851 [Eimeria magna]